MALAAAALACVSATAGLWPSDPGVNIAVADRNQAQSMVKIAASEDGACFIGWFDRASTNSNAWVKRVDAWGELGLGEFGSRVSTFLSQATLVDWGMVGDGEGGFVAVFSGPNGQGRDIWAHRVSGAGEHVWGSQGVRLTTNWNFEIEPRIARTSDGEFVIVWARLPGNPGPFTLPAGIAMQRLNLGGQKVWGPDAVDVSVVAGESPASCEIAASDRGSVVIGWVRDTSGQVGLGRVRVQKIDAGGAPVWNGGSAVELSDVSVSGGFRPSVVSDGADGAVVAWEDHEGGMFDVRAQRLDGAGAVLFGAGGARVAVSAGREARMPSVSFDGASERTLVVLRMRDVGGGNETLVAQSLSASGARLLGDGGVELLARSGDTFEGARIAAAGGGAMLAFARASGATGDSSVHAMRVGPGGEIAWGPTRVSPETGARQGVVTSLAANGVMRVAWEGDTRADGAGDVYAQNVNPNGTLGACPGDADYNGVVNFADLNRVLGAFGASGTFLSGDVDGDGVVGFADLNLALSNFGGSC
ncbi:MAG: hypothetical protein AB7G17_06130 [Phycisphaerales bacterium]